jgi:phosphoglycerate dehydrogenase-like enzyme
MSDTSHGASSRPRLFLSDFRFGDADRKRLRDTLGESHTLFTERAMFREALASHPDVDVVCTYGPPQDLYEVGPNLRWVALSSAGAELAVERGLVRRGGPVVTTASGVHAAPISEHVFGMLLMWVRQWPEILAFQRAGMWPSRDAWPPLQPRELCGATLGVVGLGAIGRAVARLGHAFGMRVLATHRSARSDDADVDVDLIYPLAQLRELLAASDYVVLAAPATGESSHLLGAAELTAMRPHAFLVNIARGSLVDEAALIEALQSRRIGGAGLDVYEHEPLPPESALWHLPNVILSPHMAGATDQYSRRLTDLLIENIGRYRADQPLRNVVEPDRGY